MNELQSHRISSDLIPSHHIIPYHTISHHIVYYQHEATQDTIASWEGVHAHHQHTHTHHNHTDTDSHSHSNIHNNDTCNDTSCSQIYHMSNEVNIINWSSPVTVKYNKQLIEKWLQSIEKDIYYRIKGVILFDNDNDDIDDNTVILNYAFGRYEFLSLSNIMSSSSSSPSQHHHQQYETGITIMLSKNVNVEWCTVINKSSNPKRNINIRIQRIT